MEFTIGIIGTVSGLLSLATVIYLAGYWKGRVDTRLKYFGDCIDQYPPADMARMLKTLWDIYVLDALRGRPDLAEHSSPYRLKEEASCLIPDDIKEKLRQVPRNPVNREDIASGWLVVKTLGIHTIERMANKNKLSLQETVAILSTYMDNQVEK